MSKDRLSLMLCAFADAVMEKPLVIGRSKSPHCFKNVDVIGLPVIWYHNKKAWMTTKIMEDWLIKFNESMKQQNRNILLFMDNATSHPHLRLSNIKLAFFPANTTSVLQPMDQGIIYTTKHYYRRRVLARLCREMESAENVSDLCKTINVLDAIMWLASAVRNVSEKCVRGAYKKADFKFSASLEGSEEEDGNIAGECTSLMEISNSPISLAEFVSIDNGVYTECIEMDIPSVAAARNRRSCTQSR